MELINILIPTIIVLAIPWFRRLYFCASCRQNDAKMQSRDAYYDLIKGLAILAVIFIHVAYANRNFTADGKDNAFVIIMNNMARFAIPLFFICSGVLLSPIGNLKGIKNFYIRKLWRIFLPYLLCSLAFAYFFEYPLEVFLYKLIAGKADAPYYFMVVLFQLYLLYPFLCMAKSSKHFLFLTFLLSLFAFAGNVRSVFGIPLCAEYLFFFVYGMACRDKFMNYKPGRNEQYFWLAAIVLFFAVILFKQEQYYNAQFFYGLAVFNLMFFYRQYLDRKNIVATALKKFGRNSLWVYLLHFQIVLAVNGIFYSWGVNLYPRYFMVFIISAVIAYFVAKLVQIVYENLLFNIFNKYSKEYKYS